MSNLRIIPEYHPVSTLYLSFVHEFYNTRFAYGKAIAAMAKAARSYVNVEIFVDKDDLKYLERELADVGLKVDDIDLNFNSPRRAIINEWCPILGCDDNGNGIALTFNWLSDHPDYQTLKFSEEFGTWLAEYWRLTIYPLGFDFGTAGILASDQFVFISEDLLKCDIVSKVRRFKSLLKDQEVVVIPSLADELSRDLDTYLLPIRPHVWISSKYPAGSAQAKSIEPAMQFLKGKGHTVHLVPGLERICYDDIDALPNYCNSVILNNAILVPTYQRTEDEVIQGILKDYGFEVYPIDAQMIALSNSGLHCISKTFPQCLEI